MTEIKIKSMSKSKIKPADCRLKTVDSQHILHFAYCLLPTTYLPILLMTIIIFIIHTTEISPTIRYVSPTGNNIPPYLTWEDAANSIQDCINVSVFGDTIYVANGVYQEQVIMIPGLSLIGAGTDSCIIDTRAFATGDFSTVVVMDSCLFTGFYILCTNDFNYGNGIYSEAKNSLITLNKVSSANSGITLRLGARSKVFNNFCFNNRTGMYISNSDSSIIRKNSIIVVGSNSSTGISISAFNSNYTPIIDSNYIEVKQGGNYAIRKGFGSNPLIKNNVIVIKQSRGIFLSDGNSAKIYNNSIYSEHNSNGIENPGVPYLQLYNNYLMGKFVTAMSVGGSPNDVRNNVVTGANVGIEKWGTQPNPLIQYNNVWNSSVANYSNFTPDSTNLSVNPMIVNDDTTQGDLDFHLQMFSPLIDAGDPNILDKDSSRSDIGLYGGPLGESYKYKDLAPKPPRNLSAVVDSSQILVKWNRNTEADTSHYNVYRDTVANFTIDSTKLISSQTDTFYIQYPPYQNSRYVYKISCVDNQGNESLPSEELVINITSLTMNDYPMTINDYLLYQNYPNPFNPTTRIAYKLKEGGYVKLYVYDIKGELITTLVNQHQSAGYYEVEFSASSIKNPESSINELASGIYIYQIMVRGENSIPVFSDIKKMVYVK
jgi:parallel beta-helix repeat protein